MHCVFICFADLGLRASCFGFQGSGSHREGLPRHGEKAHVLRKAKRRRSQDAKEIASGEHIKVLADFPTRR